MMVKKPNSGKKANAANASTVNKSQAVRDFLAANPQAAPKEVSDALKKKGIEVSPNYVSTVKGQMKAQKGIRKRRHKAAEVASVKTGIGIPEIKAAFALLKHCGGIAEAKEALAAAVEIQKIM